MTARIGILTGGGDAPGLNAVIRAVVKTAILAHRHEVIGITDGYEGLVTRPIRWRQLTVDSVRGILPTGGTILGCSNRSDPTAHACRWKPTDPGVPDCYDVAVDGIRELGLQALVVLGGDGTLGMASEMAQRGAPIVGVPKTIDNDVAGTDITFGFDTAVACVTDAIDRLHTTAEAHQRIMIVEVMGRHAGHIALHAGVAGGADVILIPEIPFSLDAVVEKIEARWASDRHFSIVVVAEGARPIGGQEVYLPYDNPYGMRRLGGIGLWLESELFKRCPREIRVTVLGHLQRGGGPTPSDRLLATRCGVKAAQLACTGEYGLMVALRGNAISSAPLAMASQPARTIDPQGELVRVARDLGIALGDRPGGGAATRL